MSEKKGIVFEDVNKSYGHNQVVHHLNLSIREGERLILLGPSGCGKTTTLRMIAGLEKITTGKLIMGEKIVNDLEPGERNVAMVFQNYALYPHMSVWENITFGLSLQKLPLDEIKRRTHEALEILHLTGYEQRKPSELSGGQKQRVALGRAIVKQAPYFLLDEPLSNLDAQLRLQARTELVKIHEVYRPTLVYVTHDQVEAMTIGQRIAILYQGTLQQVDAPEVLYRNPANTFVASFIGAPPMNLLEADFQEGSLWLDHTRLNVPLEWQPLLAEHPQIFVGLRPELCHPDTQSPLSGNLELVELLGAQRCLHIRLPQTGQKVLCLIPAEQPIPSGDIKIAFSWNHVNLFDRQSGLNIGKPCDLSASLVS